MCLFEKKTFLTSYYLGMSCQFVTIKVVLSYPWLFLFRKLSFGTMHKWRHATFTERLPPPPHLFQITCWKKTRPLCSLRDVIYANLVNLLYLGSPFSWDKEFKVFSVHLQVNPKLLFTSHDTSIFECSLEEMWNGRVISGNEFKPTFYY